VDIDPELVDLSNNKAKRLGVADRARFNVEDVFKTDLSRATVLTLYLLPGMMLDLRPKIFNELKPGTRIVSHDYHFGDEWLSDDEISFDVPEKEMVNGVPMATVRLWVVPPRIAGNWQLKVPGASGTDSYELVLRQRYNKVEGTVAAPNLKTTRLTVSALRGEDFTFSMPLEGKTTPVRFAGKVNGNIIEGVAELPGKGATRFTATRINAAPVATP
jgi:hypothetical protein